MNSGIDMNRDMVYNLLKELANELHKELRRNKFGPQSVDLYLCGGAVMLLELGSRPTTMDIDGIYGGDRLISEKIVKIANKYNIDKNWLNQDFKKTTSYTPAIYANSHIIKEFRGLRVFAINADLLLCMKLISFRLTKHTHDIEVRQT